MRYLLRAALSVLALFVRLLDLILHSSERDGSVRRARYAIWVLANLIIVALLVIYLPSMGPPYVITGLLGLLGLHALIIVSAIRTIDEETAYWDGEIEEDETLFMRNRPWGGDRRASCIRRPFLIGFASTMLLLLAALLLLDIDAYSAWPQLKQRPIFGGSDPFSTYASYVVVCLDHVPILNTIGKALLEFWGYSYDVEWLRDAKIFPVVLFIGAGTWIYGTFRILFEQSKDGYALLRALERAHRFGPQSAKEYLAMRAARAPGFMRRRMLQRGLLHAERGLRGPYMRIFYEAKMLTFPVAFLYHLKSQDHADRLLGLDYCAQLLEEQASSYKAEFRSRIARSVLLQIKSGDYDPEVVTRLWRIGQLALTGLSVPAAATVRDQMAAVAAERLRGSANYTISQKCLVTLALSDNLANFPRKFLRSLNRHTIDVQQYGLLSINGWLRGGGKVNRARLTRELGTVRRRVGNSSIAQELKTLDALLKA